MAKHIPPTVSLQAGPARFGVYICAKYIPDTIGTTGCTINSFSIVGMCSCSWNFLSILIYSPCRTTPRMPAEEPPRFHFSRNVSNVLNNPGCPISPHFPTRDSISRKVKTKAGILGDSNLDYCTVLFYCPTLDRKIQIQNLVQ